MMNDAAVGRVHWSFWLIGAIALIWNVMGAVNFFMQMNAAVVAAMPEAQRAIVQDRPIWATGAFAITVLGGALGCVLLLLRRSAATYLFIVSLAGVIVQMLPYLVMDDSAGKLRRVELSMFIMMPLLVAAFLIGYSKWAGKKRWIN
jgi:hypothetical protein